MCDVDSFHTIHLLLVTVVSEDRVRNSKAGYKHGRQTIKPTIRLTDENAICEGKWNS